MDINKISELTDKELFIELTKTFDAYKECDDKARILAHEYRELMDAAWKRGYTFDDLKAIVGDYYD